MTNRERVHQLIRMHPGLTDAQIVARTGIRPHQQVNQICRRLAAEGAILRVRGLANHLINLPAEPSGAVARRPVHAEPPGRDRPPDPVRATAPVLRARAPTLVLVQCSKSKVRGGRSALDGPRVEEILPQPLARAIARAREAVAPRARRDDRLLMPAASRYDGTLYATAGDLIASPPPDVRCLILSGGYGLVLPDEPIGYYDRKFRIGDWPTGLLERCLPEAARALGCAQVVALCATTSDYARLVRQAEWETLGVDVRLGWPDMAGRGGAQVAVPRAMGEAVRALAAGRLDDDWSSTEGVRLVWERLA